MLSKGLKCGDTFAVPNTKHDIPLFMLASGVVVVNTFYVSPGRALVGIVLILIGAPAYWFWRRKSSVVPVT